MESFFNLEVGKMKMRAYAGTAGLIVALLWLLACGGEPRQEAEPAEELEPVEIEREVEPPAAVDAELAERGEALMSSRGCAACHTMGGGRLVGPDLAGVSEKRSERYLIGMITNPDSMLIHDATAKALLAEYYTPMPKQGVSREEAEALVAYFRHEDAERRVE